VAFEVFRMFGTLALEGAEKVTQQLDGLSGKLQSWGQNLTGMGKKMTMGLTLPIAGLGIASFKMAGDFDQVMRAVNVMLGASQEEMADYKKAVLDISSATGKSSVDVARSFYQIVSVGFRGADSIKILETAVKGATGGMADAEATAAALAKAMSIFALEGVGGSSRAMDTFFGIVDTGLLTFEELATTFPRATQQAAGLGISIEEAGAALGVLTKVSGSTEQAATALNGVFTQLIKPSGDLQELYQQWGVENGPQAIEKFGGLQGVLQKVTEATGGNVDKLAELFPNVEAVRAVLPLTTTNAEDFARAIETVTDSSGKTNKAFEEMAQGPGFQLNQFMQTLKNGMITLGDAIAKNLGPYLQKFIGWVQGIIDWFSRLDPRWQKVILGIGIALAALGPILMAIGTAMIFLNAVMAASPVTWIVLGIVAAIAALIAIGILLWKNWDKIVNFLKNVWNKIKKWAINTWNKIKDFFINLWNKIKEVFKAAWEWIKNIFLNYTPYGLIIQHWDKIVEWFRNLWDKVKEAFRIAWDWIKNILLNYTPQGLIIQHWDKIVEFFRGIWEKVKQWTISVWNSIKEFFSGLWNSVKEIFSTALEFILNLFFKYHPIGIIISHWNEITEFFSGVWEKIKQIFIAAFEKIKELFFQYHPLGIIVTHWDEIIQFFQQTWENIRLKFAEFRDRFLEIWRLIHDRIIGWVRKIVDWVKSKLDLVGWVKGVFDRFGDAISGSLSRAWEKIKTWVDKIKEKLREINPWARGSPSLVDNVRSGFAEIEKIISGFSGGFELHGLRSEVALASVPSLAPTSTRNINISGKIEIALSGQGIEHLDSELISEIISERLIEQIKHEGARR